jgi:hypothetical protein
MRVTKTVREYIEKEVTARMERKYADEAAEAKRQRDLYETIEADALSAAAEAYKTYVLDKIRANNAEDFLSIGNGYGEGIKLRHDYRGGGLTLTHDCETASVLSWRQRMKKEAADKCENIIVTLELGGTKAELMQMLSEI